jgi:hypothetical protein
MRRKLIVILLGILMVFSILYAIPYFQGKDSNEIGSSGGLSLLIPPVQAQTTPALDTSTVGFIAYYQRVVGWTLADTVPAFISYSDGGNYYDGVVRVWSNGNIGEAGSGHYVDVKVRVRSDGWILAWLNRTTDDSGEILYWQAGSSSVPAAYSTSLSRAIEIVYYVAGVGFPGYDAIGLYDYSQPSASRLLMFGKTTISSNNVNWYYTIPDGSALVPVKLIARSAKAASSGTSTLYIDGGQVFSRTGSFDWTTYVLDANQYLSQGTQHTVSQNGGTTAYYLNVALIVWAG